MALTLWAYFTRPNWLPCQFVFASLFAVKERRDPIPTETLNQFFAVFTNSRD
jgi:hypothetical protein